MKAQNYQTESAPVQAGGKPAFPSNGSASNCCQSKDVWLQAWGNPSGYCDAGCSGAHLSYYWTYGCERHQQYMGRISGEVDRHCPQNCEWSKALAKGGAS